MRLNGEYVLREIMGEYVVVPIQTAESQFSGLLTLNEAGAFLWSQLQSAKNVDELCECMCREYEVDEAAARTDVKEFLEKLAECHILQE